MDSRTFGIPDRRRRRFPRFVNYILWENVDSVWLVVIVMSIHQIVVKCNHHLMISRNVWKREWNRFRWPATFVSRILFVAEDDSVCWPHVIMSSVWLVFESGDSSKKLSFARHVLCVEWLLISSYPRIVMSRIRRESVSLFVPIKTTWVKYRVRITILEMENVRSDPVVSICTLTWTVVLWISHD